jgi:hypothetical protein
MSARLMAITRSVDFLGARLLRASCFAATAALLATAACAAPPKDAGPLEGTWQYDPTQSSFRGAIPYTKATYSFKQTKDGVHVVVDILEGRNTNLHFEYVDKFDGKFVPVTGNPFYEAQSSVWKDVRTLERSERRGEEVTGKTLFTVAEDGKSFTSTASRTLPNGRVYTSTIFWNRVEQ